ncbi:MAG: High-affinity nickel transporter [Planctomycetota bacterium]
MHSILWGIAAGSAHVASGPDHLAALAPLAVASRLRALWIGAAWGVGHGAGVLFLGGLGLLGRDLCCIESLSAWSELLVGVLLIWLGGWALFRCRRPTAATHDRRDSARRHVHGAFGIGFLHGAAGLSHLFGVVPSLVMTRTDAAQYLVAYLLGAILAMTLFGWAVGLLSRTGGARVLRLLFVVAGVTAVGLGCYWLGGAWPATLG